MSRTTVWAAVAAATIAAVQLGAAAGAQAQAARAAPAARTVELRRLFPHLEKYWTLAPAERNRFTPAYYVRQNGRAPQNLKLAIVRGGAREPLPLSPDGRIERLPSAGDLQGRTQVAVDAPAGSKFSIGMELEATVRPGAEFPAGDLVAAVDQSNAAIRRFAGVLGFAAPHMARVSFAGARSGVAVLADGRTAPLPSTPEGAIFDPAVLKGARTIRLTQAPDHVYLLPAAKK
jgi:hypothetical protein